LKNWLNNSKTITTPPLFLPLMICWKMKTLIAPLEPNSTMPSNSSTPMKETRPKKLLKMPLLELENKKTLLNLPSIPLKNKKKPLNQPYLKPPIPMPMESLINSTEFLNWLLKPKRSFSLTLNLPDKLPKLPNKSEMEPSTKLLKELKKLLKPSPKNSTPEEKPTSLTPPKDPLKNSSKNKLNSSRKTLKMLKKLYKMEKKKKLLKLYKELNKRYNTMLNTNLSTKSENKLILLFINKMILN